MTKPRLYSMIDGFLQERRESHGGGWAQITGDDVKQLSSIIDALVKLKCEKDADGDCPIEWDLTNRRTHQRSHYIQIPYDRKLDDDGEKRELTDDEREDRLELLMFNLGLAQDAVNQEMKMRRYFRNEKKRAGK